jgi:hypothetical protein
MRAKVLRFSGLAVTGGMLRVVQVFIGAVMFGGAAGRYHLVPEVCAAVAGYLARRPPPVQSGHYHVAAITPSAVPTIIASTIRT